jgi:hypothetical protein
MKTIEAIYDNGKIIPIGEDIKKKKARVLLTFLDEDTDDNTNDVKGISASILLEYSGKIKTFNEDPVAYQRKLRNEW